MPSLRYYQQTAPFWDMVADFEGQGFTGRGNRNNNDDENEENNHPWAAAFGPWPFQAARHHGHEHGTSDAQAAPETEAEDPPISTPNEDPEAGPSQPRGPPPPFGEGHHPHPHHQHGSHPHRGRGRHGRCGGRGGRGWGGGFPGMGGPGFGAGAYPGGGFPFMGGIENMLKESLFGGNGNNTDASKSGDFKPEADVFDTEDSYVIHISLPGAKKEDVGVNWEADKSELSIAGVIHRPGDEDFLKTLALDERKVGAFERKVRLGSRANPAQVDVEGITAKLEDGVLRIVVPKLNGEFVEIKKVDIE
ncbi:hypothetical protein Q7P37_010406 [Cladosporium fusiforme]